MPSRPAKRADLAAIGKRIRQVRGDEGQEVFAPRLGITQSQLSKVERGVLPPSIEVLLRLKKEFGKSVDWILTGDH
jgi:transcriptional regulator with XRE-family HTH domain